jgi:signal transduction histidine kinase
MTDVALTSTAIDERLVEITDVVIAIASNHFDRRATVGDGFHLLDGLALGVNMLSEEIGQRVAREKAYQQHLLQNERLIAVGQLAAGVAHEVNNPAAFVLANLSVLRSTLDALEQAQVSADDASRATTSKLLQQARELTRDNIAGVERIVAIVRDLRNFARLDNDRLDTLELAEIVDDACSLVRAEVTYRAALVVETDAALRVRGDRTKLAQVFTNLLLNAAQAIPEGESQANRVEIAAAVQGDWARVLVRDTGGGMSEEARRRMFEPFFTTKPRDRGTGLGLAISSEIVHQHGGELRLLQTTASGTTFEVLLPLDRQHGPQRAQTASVTGTTPEARVLIVDDETMLLTAYRRWLDGVYHVQTAVNGREAIGLLEHDADWDAILCDIMMPEVDGVGVYEWVATHRPEMLERLLFCTGGAFTTRSLAFTERMGDRVLQKPVALPQLRDAIERVRPRPNERRA